MTDNENNGLSEKAKENLRKNAELRESTSKFIKLQPNEKRTLNQFLYVTTILDTSFKINTLDRI